MEDNNIQKENVVEAEFMTPTPQRKEHESITMSFIDAMREIVNGKTVRRISWPEDDYSLLKDGWIVVHTGGKDHSWTISDGDIEGEDWIVKEANG